MTDRPPGGGLHGCFPQDRRGPRHAGRPRDGLFLNIGAAVSSRVDAERGHGLAVFSGGFTGTPNVGFGLSDTACDDRIGWRLTSAAADDPGFSSGLDLTRREATGGGETAKHGVMLRSSVRW